jgi:hypothetical protein
MEFIYEHLHNNCLLDILKNEEIARSLAYMVDFNEHQNLKITPKNFHIEIANADITIAVLVYVGFEGKEYEELQTKPNFHVISFDQVTETLFEFENIKVRYINPISLFFMALEKFDDPKIIELREILLIEVWKNQCKWSR